MRQKNNYCFKLLSLGMVFHTEVIGWFSHLPHTPWRRAIVPILSLWSSHFTLCFIISAQPFWFWPGSWFMLVASLPAFICCMFPHCWVYPLAAFMNYNAGSSVVLWLCLLQGSTHLIQSPGLELSGAELPALLGPMWDMTEASNGNYQATVLSQQGMTPEKLLT